jgi:murein L,D-transpeptidase YcbB/YkuD
MRLHLLLLVLAGLATGAIPPARGQTPSAPTPSAQATSAQTTGAQRTSAPTQARPDAAQSRQIAEAVRAAADQGLDPAQFPADPAAAAIALAAAEHGQRLPRSAFPKDWAIRPAPYDAAADFQRALAENRLGPWLAGLGPPDPRYDALVRLYGRYRALAEAGGWPALAKSKLAPGDSGAAVAALRARLAIEDPALTPAPVGAPAVYDAALSDAVKRAQARYGLEPDGKAGPATVAALSVPAAGRLLQIRANLERWRWMPRALPAMRIELNTADASLQLFDGAAPAMVMRAIVGKPSTSTPMFRDAVHTVTFNPPWNVPASIAAKEVWPKIRRRPGYMAREGFVVRPGGGLQQRPGPRCALGAVKFELDNPFGVYLHDTPSRSLFALSQRNLSHGCMRLAEPLDLAKRLLQGDPAWPETRINMVLLSGETTRAPLRQPVPLFVVHWTAFVDEGGQAAFRPDVYGWDADLTRALADAGRPL